MAVSDIALEFIRGDAQILTDSPEPVGRTVALRPNREGSEPTRAVQSIFPEIYKRLKSNGKVVECRNIEAKSFWVTTGMVSYR